MAIAKDYVAIRNSTSRAQPSFSQLFPFSAGLHGVDQATNWLSVHATVIIFCTLLLFTLCLRLTKKVVNHIRHISIVGNPQQQRFWETNRTTWWPWLKEHFFYAPLFRTRHNREFRILKKSEGNYTMGTLPGRGLTLLLVLYWICNIIYCVWLPWSGPNSEVLAALRGRSGVLAAFNLVPTVLFALRNNPLISWLEISYDTFNMLHRWLARVTIMLAVVHALSWLSDTLREGGWHAVHLGFIEKPHGPSFQAGLVGTVAFLVLLIHTWSPLRHAFYETFLNIHKLMAALAIAGVYMHLRIDHIIQLSWVQFALAIWIIEYMLRAAWIVWHNFSWKRGISRVTVEALPSEACRLTFDLAGQPMKQSPGVHSHVYLPALSYHSSHPFSIAWMEDASLHAEPLGEKLPVHEQDAKNLSFDRLAKRPNSQVSFIIRARDGFTRALFDRASQTQDRLFTTWGFVEGPYGGRDNLASYGTVLMFAGGVGITHMVSYIRDLIQKYDRGVVGTRKIILVWSVPNTEALEWVKPWMDHILRLPGRREILTVKLFVTRPRNNSEVQSRSGSVQVFPGRCDPQAIVDKAIIERHGAMAVTVCGPGAFADDVRRAVRKRVQVGVIDFVEEAFTY